MNSGKNNIAKLTPTTKLNLTAAQPLSQSESNGADKTAGENFLFPKERKRKIFELINEKLFGFAETEIDPQFLESLMINGEITDYPEKLESKIHTKMKKNFNIKRSHYRLKTKYDHTQNKYITYIYQTNKTTNSFNKAIDQHKNKKIAFKAYSSHKTHQPNNLNKTADFVNLNSQHKYLPQSPSVLKQTKPSEKVFMGVKFVPKNHKSRQYYSGSKKGGISYLEYLQRKLATGQITDEEYKLKLQEYTQQQEAKANKNIDQDNSSYADYAEYRTKTTGFFDKNGKFLSDLDLKESIKQLKDMSNKENLIWDIVINFDAAFAKDYRLYQTDQDLRNIVSQNIVTMFKNADINPDNLDMKFVFHNNTDNPHFHILINEITHQRNKGVLKNDVIGDLFRFTKNNIVYDIENSQVRNSNLKSVPEIDYYYDVAIRNKLDPATARKYSIIKNYELDIEKQINPNKEYIELNKTFEEYKESFQKNTDLNLNQFNDQELKICFDKFKPQVKETMNKEERDIKKTNDREFRELLKKNDLETIKQLLIASKFLYRSEMYQQQKENIHNLSNSNESNEG